MSDTPLAIDLCCGSGGWAAGLIAAGFRVIGFDIKIQPDYPGSLVVQDVCTLDGRRLSRASLIVASPPCHEFTYRDLPWGRLAKLPAPDMTIWEACLGIHADAQIQAGRRIPLIVENVRGAQEFLGRAVWHVGPFYLWGDVPALMPRLRVEKGMRIGRHKLTGIRAREGPQHYSSRSEARRQFSLRAARVPFDLAFHIGRVYAHPS